MMLTIAILSGLGMLISMIKHLADDEFDMNLVHSTIFVLAVWDSCFPLAIIAMVLGLIAFLNGLNKR